MAATASPFRPTFAEEVARIFEKAERGLGGFDIFVGNAHPDLPDSYRRPTAMSLEQWDAARDSQAKAFLVGVREATRLMGSGGRIIAVTYGPSARTGNWQPFFAIGSGGHLVAAGPPAGRRAPSYFFEIRNRPSARWGRPERSNVSMASAGEETRGSPWRLNDVFSTAPIPVRRSNSRITR